MNDLERELFDWTKEIAEFHFPRWEELPDFDLYMDQVLNLIDNYLYVLKEDKQSKIITASMVNNYVKLDLIPAPVKKRYNKKHLAYLIAISVLKQVLTISEVKEGILYQASVSGIREAYDLFCTEQEDALSAIASHIEIDKNQPLPLLPNNTEIEILVVRTSCIAVASKITTQKVLALVKKNKTDKSQVEKNKKK
ncbi:protein of unknown function [Carnobacterium iners]|uniref:DUF1836 domain-containing protein n=1 Tax=Carnobacterium iners TaxID=1073423 RepID=A0A1X7NJ97_9LACT|nr:DUF1836 domain-containing protein [Carnobacterium iners]SEK81478.1 protein of unknown function [Carnobacterium iners]SMH37235.1 protein of unknown function [Carnobacterium iners]